MSTFTEILEQSTDAVFGIDTTGGIRFSNDGFERLLGYDRWQLRGRRCAEVLCGTDVYGQAFCGPNCPISKTLPTGPPGGDFDLVVKRADGDLVLVNVGTSYVPPQLRDQVGQVDVFFGLRPVCPLRLMRRLATAPAEGSVSTGARGRCRLTPREREILVLAAQGLTTAGIAERLSVSLQTIRTHFRNIYRKIGVKTRSEAALFAMRYGLH